MLGIISTYQEHDYLATTVSELWRGIESWEPIMSADGDLTEISIECTSLISEIDGNELPFPEATQSHPTSQEDEADSADSKNAGAEHVYNSQMFNYEMIVDLIAEVQKEISSGELQLLLIENKLRDLYVRLFRSQQRKKIRSVSLKLQIETFDNTRCMYQRYIAAKREKMDRLRCYAL